MSRLPMIGGALRATAGVQHDQNKTGRGAIRGRSSSGARRLAYLVISTSLVSGRKKKPTTTVIDAKMIGYQRPAKISPVAATIAKALAGNNPPNQPLPM